LNLTDIDIHFSFQSASSFPQAEADAQRVQPPPKPAGINNDRKRRRQRKSVILDEDFTVIPPGVFHTWLQDTSDIVKDHNHRVSMPPVIYSYNLANMNYKQKFLCQAQARIRTTTTTMIEKLMSYPSTSFLSTSTRTGFSSVPCCPNPLLQLWNENLQGREKILKGSQEEGDESEGIHIVRSIASFLCDIYLFRTCDLQCTDL